MTATTTPLAVPTDLEAPDCRPGSLTHLADAVSVTDPQDRRGLSTPLPNRSSLVDDDLVRHTEADYAGR